MWKPLLTNKMPSRVHVSTSRAHCPASFIVYTAFTGLWQVNKIREVQASTTPECFVLQFYWLLNYYDSSQEWQPAKMSWRNRRLWDSEIYSYLECFGQLDDESALSQFFQTYSKKWLGPGKFSVQVSWTDLDSVCPCETGAIGVACQTKGTAFRSWGVLWLGRG